jgi:hydroxypyruvate isomerase
MINRRSALKSSALVLASAAIANRLGAAEQAMDAALRGRINHSACRWCYSKIPLDTLCEAGKAMGLKSIDLVKESDFPTLKKFGLQCAMVDGVPGSIPEGFNRVEHHDKLVAFFEHIIPVVADAGFPNIICFSGNRKGMSDEEGLKNCATGLKRVVALAEKHKVNVVMELLNSKVNHKDYMCDHTAWGVELCKQVGSERFKLLYDIYHMQIMEGDVISTIQQFHTYFAHYHTGGVPGRHEIDDSQELNYPSIMKAIVATGFTGFVAQEFIPARPDAIASLKQGVQICDV